MKKVFFIAGLALILISIYRGGVYVLDYNLLTEYGRGYVWGCIILFVIGSLLIFLSFKKIKSSN